MEKELELESLGVSKAHYIIFSFNGSIIELEGTFSTWVSLLRFLSYILYIKNQDINILKTYMYYVSTCTIKKLCLKLCRINP